MLKVEKGPSIDSLGPGKGFFAGGSLAKYPALIVLEFSEFQIVGCVIAQAFFSRGPSAISQKSRFFSAELSVI